MISERILDFRKFIFNNVKHQLFAGKDLFESGNIFYNIFIILLNFIALKTGEPLQSHLQNRLSLFFGKTKFLHELRFGFRRRFGCANQSHDRIQIIQCDF